tara:strand:+ start:1523 stop:2104 length:582 start_codon:yes stop_codon:yes gene_type:complete
MSSTATPMGAEPIGTLSASGSFTGKVRHLKIASNYGTAIFYGDFVKTVAAGTIEKDTGTTTLTPTGVFMGCSYTDPTTNQPTYSQFYPASTVASDIKAYVLDDPNVLMKMQGDDSLAQTAIGNNVAIVQTAGSTSIGRSKNAVDSSTIAATTATLPLRIIDFVDGPDSSVGDAFTDVIVKFNAGHQYDNTTGV